MEKLAAGSCDSELLRRLLQEELGDSSQRRVKQHLDDCAQCQNRLEEMAGDDNFWRETRSLLQRDLSDYSAAGRAFEVEESSSALRRKRRRRRRQQSLNLLRPSAEPESLGRLGTYEIRGIIGCGGMGTVFHAVDSRLRRPVALKVLHAAKISSDARERFHREAQTIAALNDRHIVKVFEMAQEDGIPFIAMEFVDGLSLQQLLARQIELKFKHILRIARQTASGLQAAHAAGIVHRDIKPSNVLIDRSFKTVSLTDFGLACTIESEEELDRDVVAGTPEYMSPEQAIGKPLTAQSDLFSLGTLLYVLCTRSAPFRGSSVRETLHRVRSHQPEPADRIVPQLPAWFANGIARLMSKKVAERFAGAEEYLAYLATHSRDRRSRDLVVGPAFTDDPYLRFDCPICGKRLKAERNAAGRTAQCRRCCQLLRTPATVEPVEVVRIDPTAAAILQLNGKPRWKGGALVRLDLRKTRVADDDLAAVASQSKLETLLLESTEITDKGLQYVAKLTSLRYLTLSKTKVTDDGLMHLLPLKNLRILTLAETTTSDDAVETLSQFRKLERLRLDDTAVSAEGIARLQRSIPKMRLWW